MIKFLNKKKYHIIIYILVSISILLSILIIAGKPVIKNIVLNQIKKNSDSIYSASFDKFKINWFNGTFLLTNFELSPDIDKAIKNFKQSKYLYKIKIDTFKISKINPFTIFQKVKSLNVKEITLCSPFLSVYKINKKDTTVVLKKGDIVYDTVKNDIFRQIFRYVGKIKIKRIAIKNGNIDFLKANAANPNMFSFSNITYIMNNFYIDKKNFLRKDKGLFSQSFEIKIQNYNLKLGDNIHQLIARSIYLNSSSGQIKLHNIEFKPMQVKNTDTIPQYFVMYLDSIVLKNANVKQFMQTKKLYINTAEIRGFSGDIYSNKNFIHKKKKIKFDKKAIISKIDLYKLFHNFLLEIKIDTLALTDGKLNIFKDFKSQPITSINNSKVNVINFLVDSTSLFDTSRIFYSEDINMQIQGLKHYTKNLSHIINAQYFFFSTKKQNLTIKNLTINPNISYGNLKSSNITILDLQSVDFQGFDLVYYFHNNNILIDNIDIAKSNIDFQKLKTKKEKASINLDIRQILKEFADSLKIKRISFQKGELNYLSKNKGRNDLIHSEYNATLKNFVYSSHTADIKKSITIADANILFTNVKYITPDSIYSLFVDSVFFSSALSYIQLHKINFSPTKNVFEKAKNKNKSLLLQLIIPDLKIDKTNILTAFHSDSLGLNRITLPSARFNLYFYPEIANTEAKKNIVDSIRKNTIRKLLNSYADKKTAIYETYPQFDTIGLKKYKFQIKNLDSVFKLTINTILNIKVKQKQVSTKDSSIESINTLETIFNNYADSLRFLKTQEKINELTSFTIHNINYLKKNYEKPSINIKKVLKAINNVLSTINSDTLLIQNAKLNFIIKYKSHENPVFSSIMDLKLNNLKVDTTSQNQKILFSQRARISLRKSTFFNKNIKIYTDSLHFDSGDSALNIYNLSFNKLKNGNSIINIKCKDILLKQFDLRQIIEHKKFEAKKLTFNNTTVKIYKTASDTNTNKSVFTTFIMPAFLKIIKLHEINLNNTQIKINNTDKKYTLYLNSDLKLFNFAIDSITHLNENPYFLPIDNFRIIANNLSFTSKDSNITIYAKQSVIDSKSGNIKLNNFNIENFVKIDDTTKQKTNSISINKLNLKNFDFVKFLNKKQIIFDSLFIKRPYIYTFKKQKNKKPNAKDFDFSELISKIDLYKVIKPKIKKIQAKYVNLDSIILDLNTKTDTSAKQTYYDKINLKIYDILIDSTTTVETPNLFYSDDIIIDIFDKDFALDSIYSAHFNRLTLSTGAKNIKISGLNLSPNIPLEDVQKHKKWRTTAVSLKAGYITLMKIDWKKLLHNNYLKVPLIAIDSANFVALVDRGAPHNNTRNAQHLIAPILNLPKPLSIDRLQAKNLNAYYYEINDKNNKTAYISVNNSKVEVINLTNDSNLIFNDLSYTKIQLTGKINNTAPLNFTVTYLLTDKGNTAKVTGKIGSCSANTFNTYLYNGANLSLDSGQINSVDFYFTCYDSLAIGKIDMRYKNLKTSLISADSVKRKKLKFISWIANTIVVKRNNPGINPVPKIGGIAYIHDRTYGDIKMWLKAIISGVKATVAFKPKDAHKINKIRRKNNKLNKLFEN